MCPDINNLIITFIVGYESHAVVTEDFIHLIISFGNKFGFLFRYYYIIQVEGLLDEVWAERLGGMKLRTIRRKNLPPVTTLKGRLTDQAELLGVLNSLYNLRVTL